MPRITLFALSIFLCCCCSAQNFFYSAPINVDPNIQTYIIGKVKDNIIVWRHSSLIRHKKNLSTFFIYDESMKLLNKTSYDFIRPHETLSTNLINEGSSFAFVVQYFENGFNVCKLISFDANGNLLNNQLLERSYSENENDEYVIKRSQGKETFALLKIVPSNIKGTIALQYHFVKNNMIVHSDKIVLPFDTLTSGLGQTFLDNDNLLIPIQDSVENGSRLSLFKINLNNNSSINVLRDLNNGELILNGFAINENDKRYIITSEWRNKETDINSTNRVFVWQLNKDLSDASMDTVLTSVDSINSCLSNIHYYALNNIVNGNFSNIIIKAVTINVGSNGNSFSTSPIYDYSSPSSGGFYEGRVLSTSPQKDLNGNGYYAQSNVAHGETWGGSNGSSPSLYKAYLNTQPDKLFSQVATLAVLNMDAQNHLQWSHCFNASEEKFQLIVDHSMFINIQDTLKIIYPMISEKGAQSLSSIVINADGSYLIKPILSTDSKYRYLFDQSEQLDSNSILIPSVIKDKLAFAKLVF